MTLEEAMTLEQVAVAVRRCLFEDFSDLKREIEALRREIASLKPTTVEVAPNQFQVIRGPVRETSPPAEAQTFADAQKKLKWSDVNVSQTEVIKPYPLSEVAEMMALANLRKEEKK